MSDFSRQQVKQIRQLLARAPVHAGERSVEGFLLQYVLFEALMKTVLRYFRDSNGRSVKKSTAGPESMQLNSVNKSLHHFSVLVHPEVMARLLDSKLIKRGGKSARLLRNGLVHLWDASDAKEVLARIDDLKRDLLTVISAVESKVIVLKVGE
jgi:hypothetical protein